MQAGSWYSNVTSAQHTKLLLCDIHQQDGRCRDCSCVFVACHGFYDNNGDYAVERAKRRAKWQKLLRQLAVLHIIGAERTLHCSQRIRITNYKVSSL